MSNPATRAGTSGNEGSAITLPTMTASPFSPLLGGPYPGEGKVEHVEIRRSEPSDAEQIQKLLNQQAQSYYGPRCDVVRVLERANLSLSLSFPHGGLCAHASFFDYPSTVPAFDPANWEDWLTAGYPELSGRATPFNSLFLGLFLYQDVIKNEALRECLKTAFDLVSTLQFVFFVLPRGKHLISLYTAYFTRIDKIQSKMVETEELQELAEDQIFEPNVEDVESIKSIESTEEVEQKPGSPEEERKTTETFEEEVIQNAEQEVGIPKNLDIYVSERHTLLPTLHVREAREEDSDDLAPLFLRHTEHLHMTYGDYFIAELVTGGPEKTALVAEVDGRAVGFIGISCNIDVDVLDSRFRLESYHGLRSISLEDEVKEVDFPSGSSSESSLVKKAVSNDSRQSLAKSLASQSGELNKGVERQSTISIDSVSDTRPFEDSAIVDATKASVSFVRAEGSAIALSSTSHRSQDSSEHSKKSSIILPVQAIIDKVSKSKEKITVFKGEHSALSVQLFCLDEKYESRALDFLPVIFKSWPNHDYCVLTQPHIVPEHPLLQQGYTRVPPKSGVVFDHELYVLHKGSILDFITVSLACEDDIEGIKSLVSGLNVSANVLEDLSRFLTQHSDPVEHDALPLYFFVAKCLTQIVGAVVIRTEHEIEYIRARFNIEEFIYYNYHRQHEHGHLNFCIVNPVFQRHMKFILKEVLRQSHKTCLYYPLYPAYSVQHQDTHSAMSVINAMIPVRPRRQIIYPLEQIRENAPSDKITTEQDSCVLYHFNRKLTLEPKIAINHRIVVVGTSDTSLSFLQFLLYNSSHLTFNNITLVSKRGLHSHRDNQLVDNQCIQPYELVDTCLASVVNIVLGEVIKIDRDSQNLTTSNNDVIPYDNLILCCGEQYQLPANCDVTNPVLVCNDTHELKQLEKSLLNLSDGDSNIVIYGNTIESYAALNYVLEHGIVSGRIRFVLPPYKHANNPFNNKYIHKKMEDICKEMGVQVIKGVVNEFVRLGTEEYIWNVVIETGVGEDKEKLSFGYTLFVYLYNKDVDVCAFKAMNDACLVYDGRLVIDRAFHTNDPAVYAAGPLTKFSRRYYCNPWRLKHYNSREVGEKLALEVLTKFDPLQAEPTEAQDQNLIPTFSKPKIIYTVLPGSTYYLDIFKPIPDELKTEEKSKFNPQKQLITTTEENGYFSIILDEYGYVVHVTCLANSKFEVENIIAIYGMHEKLLNNLSARYKNKKIIDFYKFFRESSLLAVFHDRFEDFKQELQQILATQPLNFETEDTFQDTVNQILQKEWKITDLHLKELKRVYADSQTRDCIRKHLMNYLNYNFYHLPMYAKGNHGMNAQLVI
ncbi:hypothetical protein LOD99_13463 [Oopsacas minuta]|uniref:Cilia- and flagella-associated protein 61 N-terminal domain-containing protein n=1 Tax=Oopsacas minuta TaxID=111878 RepID=A0AAV7KKS7_9METZ|nr:hypothetical protein LOD99_13463 [Oopsacas minuta]